MTTLDAGTGLQAILSERTMRRFTVEEYLRLADDGYLDGNTKYELLEGVIVIKMPTNPPHTSTTEKLRDLFIEMKGKGYSIRSEDPLILAKSVPEPDICIVRKLDANEYDDRHPTVEDCEIVVEVSHTTLRSDRTEMLAIYSRNKVPVYWIVNLADRCVEVHQVPNGTEAKPKYKTRKVFKEGQSVPVVLGGLKVGAVAVSDILPRPRKSSPSARR